jgi:hypothetical protein
MVELPTEQRQSDTKSHRNKLLGQIVTATYFHRPGNGSCRRYPRPNLVLQDHGGFGVRCAYIFVMIFG